MYVLENRLMNKYLTLKNLMSVLTIELSMV